MPHLHLIELAAERERRCPQVRASKALLEQVTAAELQAEAAHWDWQASCVIKLVMPKRRCGCGGKAPSEAQLREIVASGASAAAVERGNYRHFMQKEIFEQPTVVAQTLASYEMHFGEPAPEDIWPGARRRFVVDPQAVRVNPADALIVPRKLAYGLSTITAIAFAAVLLMAAM